MSVPRSRQASPTRLAPPGPGIAPVKPRSTPREIRLRSVPTLATPRSTGGGVSALRGPPRERARGRTHQSHEERGTPSARARDTRRAGRRGCRTPRASPRGTIPIRGEDHPDEGLATGRPVITCGRYDRFVEDRVTGILLPEFDAETFAQRIVELADNRALLKSMSEAAKRRVTDLCDGPARSNDLLSVWRSLMATRD